MQYGSAISVKNPLGAIEIRGWDREQLLVQLSAVGEFAPDRVMDVNIIPGGAEVVVKDTSRRLFGLLPPAKVKFDLIISVPSKAKVDAKALNGDVSISKIEGEAMCKTVNGKIQIENIVGKVQTETISGSITIVGLTPVRQSPDSGRANNPPIPTVEGLIAKSVNGGITLEEIIGSVEASTIHGNIAAKRVRLLGHESSIGTISGNLEIELLRGATEITAKTMAGKIDMRVPNSIIVQETKTKKTLHVQGTVAQARVLSLQTVNGDIVVR
jgi:DUF4097 and DUF4098 domain-containing protein YvlB